jgi:hypothetical protein
LESCKTQILALDWVTQGSLSQSPQGNWRWTRKVKAKTVTVALSMADPTSRQSTHLEILVHDRIRPSRSWARDRSNIMVQYETSMVAAERYKKNRPTDAVRLAGSQIFAGPELRAVQLGSTNHRCHVTWVELIVTSLSCHFRLVATRFILARILSSSLSTIRVFLAVEQICQDSFD